MKVDPNCRCGPDRSHCRTLVEMLISWMRRQSYYGFSPSEIIPLIKRINGY